MIETEVIIVGGGPAGSACARTLRQSGVDCLILDKAHFPRTKTCAGWVTPRVFHLLGISPAEYPLNLTQFTRIHFHIKDIPIAVRTKQYAIRRVEFDQWLLKRTGVPVVHHDVRVMEAVDNGYVLDGAYRCRFLVGAGGTYCPVYRTIFQPRFPRRSTRRITAMEAEFRTDTDITECHLWFFENRLPGYAWFVPKQDGYLNIGIGGKSEKLREPGYRISDHWNRFLENLVRLSFIKKQEIPVKGYTYFSRDGNVKGHINNAFLIGDALGMATVDMGEGIAPAIASGIRAAQAIIEETTYRPRTISRWSLPGMIMAGRSI